MEPACCPVTFFDTVHMPDNLFPGTVGRGLLMYV